MARERTGGISIEGAGDHAAAVRTSRWANTVRRVGSGLGRHGVLLLAGLIFLFPFYWLVISSLKELPDIITQEIQWWPATPTMDSYAQLLGLRESPTLEARNIDFGRAMINSTIVALISTVGTVFLSSLMGFTFSKLEFAGRRFLFLIMLITLMIPPSVGLIPTYMIAVKLDWVNTWWPLIVPSMASAFGVFWMRQYMSGVSDEMLDAARIDGCGPFRMYYQMVVPVCLPGLAALAIFCFLTSWNSFLTPLIYLQSSELYTMPLALSMLYVSLGGQPIPLDLVFAASAISILPILIVFLAAQRYFIAGLASGSTKG